MKILIILTFACIDKIKKIRYIIKCMHVRLVFQAPINEVGVMEDQIVLDGIRGMSVTLTVFINKSGGF